MSEEARDLLVYGLAAAHARDKAEARYYLEWVLRIDSDYEQQADAWYWLSTIADDPAEKREALQNVLAIFPNHPEARRDLAVVDGRLDPSEILPETERDIEPVVPEDHVSQAELRRFNCPKCGGKTVFRPGSRFISCQFCGYRPGSDSEGHGSAVLASGVSPQDWVAAIYTRKGHAWELPTTRSLRCQGCGANVTFPPSGISGSCPFCGSAYLVEDAGGQELLRPDGVLPFMLDQAGATQRFFAWIHERPLTTGSLRLMATLEPPRPVYLPVWVFDVGGEAHWKGLVLEDQFGRTVPVPTDGLVPVLFDDVLVPGSKSPGVAPVSELKFKLGNAVPYDDRYLADWPAEIYSISLSDAAVLAHEQAFNRSQVEAHIHAGAIPGIEEVSVDRIDITVNSYKHLLVALWLCDYTFKGERYRVLIDGNAGDVTGEAPRGGLGKLLGRLMGEA